MIGKITKGSEFAYRRAYLPQFLTRGWRPLAKRQQADGENCLRLYGANGHPRYPVHHCPPHRPQASALPHRIQPSR